MEFIILAHLSKSSQPCESSLHSLRSPQPSVWARLGETAHRVSRHDFPSVSPRCSGERHSCRSLGCPWHNRLGSADDSEGSQRSGSEHAPARSCFILVYSTTPCECPGRIARVHRFSSEPEAGIFGFMGER